MRRFIIALFCCLMLVTTVSAENLVTELDSSTVVSSNGTCQVTITLKLSLDSEPEELWFPLPKDARDITVNGSSAKTRSTSASRDADLSGEISAAGQHTLVIHYSLPDAVTKKGGQLYLNLTILNGFGYPIENMSFSVELPGEPERDPEFISTYHREGVEALMDYSVAGNTIHCSFTTDLKDHESLSMTLAVSEALFPQSVYKRWSLSSDDMAMYVLTLVALVYWLIFLRAVPFRAWGRPNGPEGLNAGEYPCVLMGKGVDLTAMVISWAQMGYLMIQVDRSGRVLLHKRMEMGNERSEGENRLFRSLFGNRWVVDGTGRRYGELCRKASSVRPGIGNYFKKNSGNPYYFRIISAAIGIFGGISLAAAMATDTANQTALSVFLGILGALAAWQIQAGAASVFLRKKRALILALLASFLWLLLNTRAGEPGVALYILATQWLTGFAAAYGGRRTELGRQMLKETLGLRRFFRTASRKRLGQILEDNPEYFYDMAPYALVLGADRIFAWRVGHEKLPECAYLTGVGEDMTAAQWNRALRYVVRTLDAMQARQILERIRGMIRL